MRILVIGASGYIGGRPVPLLLERGHEVRLGGRQPGALGGRFPGAEAVQADRYLPDPVHVLIFRGTIRALAARAAA